MFSLKNSIRRAVTLTIASALATTVFVGCTKQEPVDSNTSTTISSTTTAITNDLTPGITDTGVEDSGIQFKYWYDGDLAVETQKLSATATDAMALTGAHFMDIEKLPIRKDTDGNEYIISGRTQVYLSHGKMASKDLYAFLRDDEGYRYYTILPAPVKDLLDIFGARMLASGKTQAATFEERVSSNDQLEEINKGLEYDVFLNNIDIGNTFSESDSMIDISSILQNYSLGCYLADSNTLRLYTACGNVDIEFIETNGTYTLKYSTNETYEYVSTDEVGVSDSRVMMSLDAIQRYLGYQVEVYDNFINIVTDNKDILTDDHSIDLDVATEVSDSNLNDYDTDKPIDEQLPEDYKPADDNPLADAEVYDGPTSAELSGIDPNDKPADVKPAETTYKEPVQTEPKEVSKPAEDEGSYDEYREYYDSKPLEELKKDYDKVAEKYGGMIPERLETNEEAAIVQAYRNKYADSVANGEGWGLTDEEAADIFAQFGL